MNSPAPTASQAPAVFVNPSGDSVAIRSLLYAGNVAIFTSVPAVVELVEYARLQLREIFRPHDPQQAHEHFSPEAVATLLGRWKPAFMREERAKRLEREIVDALGFSLDDTHIDLLKPRTAFPVGHLTTGIAFAFPWHRDSWYAAPAQQINWWLPIFDVAPDNAMMFDFASFARPVANTSSTFDYYQINRDRARTAEQVKIETQSRPAAVDHNPVNPSVLLPDPGSVMLFAGTQLHASIPNRSGRTRYSIDFRTVDRADVLAGVGAPLVDVDSTGTSIRDFVSARTDAPFDEALVRRIYGEPPTDAVLVYAGAPASS